MKDLTVVDLLRRAKIYVDTVSIMDDYISAWCAWNTMYRQKICLIEVDFEEFDMVVLTWRYAGNIKFKRT